MASQGAGQPLPCWQATSRPDALLGGMTEVNHKLTGSRREEKVIIIGPTAQSGMKAGRHDGPMSPFCAHELSESCLPGGENMARAPFAILPRLILNQ